MQINVENHEVQSPQCHQYLLHQALRHICTKTDNHFNSAWPSGSERSFYDGHDGKVDGSTLTQASLLRPWIRCFTSIISARWNISSKLKKSEVKFKRKTRK